jgi:hypothetical protein
LFLFLCCTFLARLLDRDFDWEGQEYGLFSSCILRSDLALKKSKKKRKDLKKKFF